jgi:hypothetical protein
VLFCVRVPVGHWGTPKGPATAPRPRRAQSWRHRTARGGVPRQSPNRPIARRIRRRRERPGRRRVRRFRCGESAECAGRVPAAVCRAGTRRCTMPRGKAKPTPSLLLHGADGAVQSDAGYRCAAPHSRTESKTAAGVQEHAEAMGGTAWEAGAVRDGGEAGACRSLRPFLPRAQPTGGFGAVGRTAPPGEGRGAPPFAVHIGPHGGASACAHDTSMLGQVLIGL